MAIPNNTNGANTYLPPCPVLQPFLTIANITQANPCVVTVNENNTYVIGQVVYFSVPQNYGMYEINSLSGQIIGINGQDFIVDIDTTTFNKFIPNPTLLFSIKPASLSPSGSRNIYNFTSVPFHSEGNFGN